MIVTHKQSFTIKQLVYKIIQLSHTIAKNGSSNFQKSQCSRLDRTVVVGNLCGQL